MEQTKEPQGTFFYEGDEYQEQSKKKSHEQKTHVGAVRRDPIFSFFCLFFSFFKGAKVTKGARQVRGSIAPRHDRQGGRWRQRREKKKEKVTARGARAAWGRPSARGCERRPTRRKGSLTLAHSPRSINCPLARTHFRPSLSVAVRPLHARTDNTAALRENLPWSSPPRSYVFCLWGLALWSFSLYPPLWRCRHTHRGRSRARLVRRRRAGLWRRGLVRRCIARLVRRRRTGLWRRGIAHLVRRRVARLVRRCSACFRRRRACFWRCSACFRCRRACFRRRRARIWRLAILLLIPFFLS